MTPAAAARGQPDAPPARMIHLFGGPYVTCDLATYAVPQGSKRLLAFLAIRRGRVERSYIAGSLWPTGDDSRAQGNLRSSLWRLRRAGIDVVLADKWSMTLADDVQVNLALRSEWADRFLRGTPCASDLTLAPLPADAFDLLPGWYDDWVVIERERIRQRLMHALEALSRLLANSYRYDDAVEIGLAVVAAEPLRESAQRVLIEALLAQGNPAEAERVFVEFRALLARELGVEPSCQLGALLAAHRRPRVRTVATLPPTALSR